MKYTKKLLSLVLVLVLALALAVPGMAAGTGSITVTNATEGKDYAGYKIFDATYTGTGDDQKVSYTIKNTAGYQFYAAVSDKNSPFTLTPAAGEANTFVVSVKEGWNDTAIINWIKGVDISGMTPDLTSTEASSTEIVTWNNVPYGYYYITSELGTVITVDSNLPDVNVVDKNQIPGGDPSKTAGEEDYEIGETIPFEISFKATSYDGDQMIKNYYVTDTMDAGMAMVRNEGADNDVTVTIYQANGTTVLETLYFEASDNGFNITIPWAESSVVEGATVWTSKYDNASVIKVTYNAKLTSQAAIDGNGNDNNAIINWDVNDGESIPVKDTVYTYALAIQKVDKQGNGLAGATFVLKDADGEVVKVSGSNGTYTVDPTVAESATITSPASGLIVIKGVDGDEYTLTETKAPLGYNLLKDPVEVQPTKTGGTTTSKTIYLDADGNQVSESDPYEVDFTITADVGATAYAVVNFTGTELPSTGGMGTTIFYTLGGVLVVGAAILLVTKKRVHDVEG